MYQVDPTVFGHSSERISITIHHLDFMEKAREHLECYMVSWDEACRLARILARKIRRDGFKPDLVIGIARGGLVPARTVCDFLLQKDLASVKIEHWGIAQTQGKAKIKFPLPVEVDISGKRVLIVDDVADSGDSFSVLMEYLKEKNPAQIRTAVLQYKTGSTFVPDYWGEKQDKWKWIIYPWAVYEDLTDFIARVLTRPETLGNIRKNLKRDFDLKISSNDLLEILKDMQMEGRLNKRKREGKIFWEMAQVKDGAA